MRSGTTSLARYLGIHPHVFMAPVKEVHYFDWNFDRGVEWYRRQFAEAGTARAIGEATTSYMYDPQVPGRMAALLPDARLVALLRNPVDRAYSHYWHKRVRGKEPLDFEAAIAAESDRLARGDSPDALDYSYVDRGRYLTQLARVTEHYPREALQVVLFEDLRDRAAETFQSVCRFLGLGDEFVPPNLGEPINRFTKFRSTRLRHISGYLPGLVGKAVGKLNAANADYPPVDPAVRRQLVAIFEADVAALEAWLGRDLSLWRQ
jgi:hypothetical protein